MPNNQRRSIEHLAKRNNVPKSISVGLQHERKAVTADGFAGTQVEDCTVKRDSEGDWEELEFAGE